MKTFSFKRIVTFVLALAMCFTLFACNNNKDESASDEYAFMTIDINPTVEFVLENGKVVSVNAVNDDAAVLVSSESFIGKTAEEVSKTVVELAEELGYLNDTNLDVKITVSADEQQVIDDIIEKAKKGAKRGSEKAEINTTPRFEENRRVKKLKEENAEWFKNLTPEKLRLIEAIMRYDETFTVEMGTEMKTKELLDILKGYIEEYEGLVGEQLKAEYKEKVDQLKAEIEEMIANVLGEDYVANWEKFEALEKAYKDIEKKAEKIALTQDDITEIMALLSIENVELISFNGVVTVESVERYLDKHFDDRFIAETEKEVLEQLEEAIEDILEKYDEDEYVLTQEDITALETAWGEALELTAGISLEEVEEILKAKKELLEDLKESIEAQLTEAQKMQIKVLKEQLKGFKKNAYEQMHNRIEEVKNHFHNIKEERKNQPKD